MQLPLITLLPLVAANAVSVAPQHIFANPPPGESVYRIPTSYESAVLARRILHLTPLATLATVFPDSSSHGADSNEQRPQHLAGVPIGMMDYISDCEADGNPTILAMNIATSFKNVAAGSNISVSMSWTPPNVPSHQSQPSSPNDPTPLPYSAAALPRFSLLGTLEPISPSLVDSLKLAQCFTATHPDAKYWLPGNPIHTSYWVRLVVKEVYWVGGFGDRNYIGWIPVDEWKAVGEEWKDVRLPGEEGFYVKSCRGMKGAKAKGLLQWIKHLGRWEL